MDQNGCLFDPTKSVFSLMEGGTEADSATDIIKFEEVDGIFSPVRTEPVLNSIQQDSLEENCLTGQSRESCVPDKSRGDWEEFKNNHTSGHSPGPPRSSSYQREEERGAYQSSRYRKYSDAYYSRSRPGSPSKASSRSRRRNRTRSRSRSRSSSRNSRNSSRTRSIPRSRSRSRSEDETLHRGHSTRSQYYPRSEPVHSYGNGTRGRSRGRGGWRGGNRGRGGAFHHRGRGHHYTSPQQHYVPRNQYQRPDGETDHNAETQSADQTLKFSSKVQTSFQALVDAVSQSTISAHEHDDFMLELFNLATNLCISARRKADRMTDAETHELKSHNQELRDKVNDMQEELKMLDLKLNEVQTELEEAQMSRDSLQKNLEKEKKCNEQLTKELEASNKVNDILSDNFQSTKMKLDTLAQSHHVLQQSVCDKEQELSKCLKEINKLNLKINEEIAKNVSSQNKLGTYENACKESEKNVEKVKNEMEKLQADALVQARVRDDLSRKVEELNGQLTSKSYAEGKLLTEKRKIEQELKKQTGICETLNRDNLTLKSSMDQGARESIQLQERIKTLEANLDAKCEELEDFRKSHQQIMNILLRQKPNENLKIEQEEESQE